MESYKNHILEFNRQLGFKSLTAENFSFAKNRKKPDGIIVAGMGGSGLPGDVLLGLAEEVGINFPVMVWKDFGLPKVIFKNPLYVFVSFSGNTIETISGLNKLLRRKTKPMLGVVTTGGLLKKVALQNKLPAVYFDSEDLTPREALGYNYYGLIKLLKVWLPSLKSPDFSGKIKPFQFERESVSLAKNLRGRAVLIYTDFGDSHLGHVWKTNLNETAKQPAFANVVPEMAHNEIAAFENKSFKATALFLTDSKTSLEVQNKINAIQKVLQADKIPVIVLKLKGKTLAEKTWNSVVLSHLTSLYLAKLNRVNPTQTRLIDKLKSLLR